MSHFQIIREILSKYIKDKEEAKRATSEICSHLSKWLFY